MNGNVCPRCGKPVMTYGRYFREAEPYKISACDCCGVRLRRNRAVYLIVAVTLILLAAILLPACALLLSAGGSFWVLFPLIVFVAAGWILFVSYTSWRLVRWVVVDPS